jgi:integrase
MRAGEIGALEIDHIDFLRRELHVRQQRVQPEPGRAYVCAPKTRSSRRTIPLADVTLAALAKHVELHPGTVQVLDKFDPRNPHYRPARVLFPWPIAAPDRMAAPLEVRKRWNRAVLDANKELAARKLPTFPGGRESGLHCLRHFYASMLITAGESVTVVQRRLGHANASTTLNTYSHLWPDSNSRTRDVITAMLTQASAQDHADSVRTGGWGHGR